MKKTIYLFALCCSTLVAQSPGYYENLQQLTGDALEDALHELIKDHSEFSYSSAKQILKDSDQDPNNTDNVILVYKENSIPKSNFASNNQSDYWNREHVWAKSHGNFTNYGDLGAYSDAHNLKPCDATINSDRGYKDFDNGGTQNSEATNCYSTSTTWEPGDNVKGDVARIIFYMHTRYSGNGEPNLNIVDFTPTFPNSQMGKLSTLLEWNELDPVDAFERRRNDVIYGWQKNRNPFVDYPELANRIWGDAQPNNIQFVDVSLGNAAPNETDIQTISAEIIYGASSELDVVMTWGTSWFDMTNQVTMTSEGDTWSASIPAQAAGSDIKYKIVAQAGSYENAFYGNYEVTLNPFLGTITSIQSIQGTTNDSPFAGQTVSTTGIVTGTFGNSFYIQNGTGVRSGIYVYSSPVFPELGDSVIVTGEISEYYTLTEFAFPDDVYILTSNNPIPEPIEISTSELANEDLEGVLVKVSDVTVTYATFNFDDYGAWRVNDGSGECIIHNTEGAFEYPAVVGEELSSVTGICNFSFDEWKIELRMEDDVQGGASNSGLNVTSVEAINQSRIDVLFSNPVTSESAENTANYSITNNAVVTSAVKNLFQPNKVTLTVENMNAGNYTLTIENVQDEEGNVVNENENQFNYLSVNDSKNTPLTIYPNPSNGIISIDGLEKGATFEVCNTLGKVIRRYNASGSAEQINLNLTNGLYFIKYKSNVKQIVVN